METPLQLQYFLIYYQRFRAFNPNKSTKFSFKRFLIISTGYHNQPTPWQLKKLAKGQLFDIFQKAGSDGKRKVVIDFGEKFTTQV
jgi:hypothetical protein